MNSPERIDSNVNPDPKVQSRYIDRVLGTISIALGIITIIVGFIPCVGWLCFLPAALGLGTGIFGFIQARKQGVSSKLSTYGIILNIIGLLGFLIPNVFMGTDDITNTTQDSH